MKTIYVTVAEFLENGGELTPGRKIFSATGIFRGKVKEETDKYIVCENGEYLSNMIYFVQIECTPIYK
jgi:hypothetical protein